MRIDTYYYVKKGNVIKYISGVLLLNLETKNKNKIFHPSCARDSIRVVINIIFLSLGKSFFLTTYMQNLMLIGTFYLSY